MATITPQYETPQVVLDNTGNDPTRRATLIIGGHTLTSVTEKIAGVALSRPKFWWWIAFMGAASLLGYLLTLIGYLVTTGPGVWGNNQPVSWGFPIINFVFWVGIGHAGTLISAILFLFRQNWRTSINRFAEAMTIFAVMCAGLFPGIHVGRPWLAFWLFPYPNQMSMWPQFRSPLLWDVFAVGTYATVSVLFWYTGMVPDFATLRDRATKTYSRLAYTVLSLGWTGSSRHWHRFEKAYLLLAALATPLVLSVHSVVSFDFAVAQLPGWTTTILPPYFVGGAIYGGFAMVITLAVPCRKIFGIEHIITDRHIDNCCKVLLGTGMIVGYSYCIELFTAWYSGHHFEQSIFFFRLAGRKEYSWAFWTMMTCNVFIPQIMWSRKARHWWPTIMLAAMAVNVGMWFERYVIVITSLSNDFLPSSWAIFKPTWVDLSMLAGSFGLFFTFFLLFLKMFPIVAMAEIKTVMPQGHPHTGPGGTMRPAEMAADYRPDEPEPGQGLEEEADDE